MLIVSAMYGGPRKVSIRTVYQLDVYHNQIVTSILRNNARSPAVGYIYERTIMRRPGFVDSGLVITDSLLDGVNPIPPGGEARLEPGSYDVSFYKVRLVAAVFGDGSVDGDGDWAKLLNYRRQIAFEVLGDAIRDLESGLNLSGSSLARHLDEMRSKRLDAARKIEKVNGDAAKKIPHFSSRSDLFINDSPQIKAANIRRMADRQRVFLVLRYYAGIRMLLRPGSPGSVNPGQHVRKMIDQYTQLRNRLAGSNQ